MATDRKSPGAPGAPGAPIPDLDVPRPAPVRPSLGADPQSTAPRVTAAPASKPAGPGGVQDYFGSGNFDADHFGDVGGGAALDTDASALGVGADIEFPSVSQDVDAASLEVERSHAPPLRGASRSPGWPTGRTPDSTAITIDPVEVRIAAEFGATPTSVFLAPTYTVRVFQRRRDLRTHFEAASQAFMRAEKARDDLLVGAIQELRGKVLLADGGEDLLAPVLEIERTALERRSALAGTNAEYDRRAKEIEDGVESLRRQAADKQAEVDKANAVLTERKAVFDRASAKKKRLYIEIRGILDVAEKSAGALSGAQSARVAELEAAVASQKPELERAEQGVKAAESALAAAESDSKQIGRRIAEGARLRRALDDEFQKQIGARSEGVSETERQRFDALAETMRRLLALRGRIVDVPQDVLAGIAKADEVVSKRATELEKLVRALDSYDRDAYQRGVIAIGVIIAVIVALIAVAVM